MHSWQNQRNDDCRDRDVAWWSGSGWTGSICRRGTTDKRLFTLSNTTVFFGPSALLNATVSFGPSTFLNSSTWPHSCWCSGSFARFHGFTCRCLWRIAKNFGMVLRYSLLGSGLLCYGFRIIDTYFWCNWYIISNIIIRAKSRLPVCTELKFGRAFSNLDIKETNAAWLMNDTYIWHLARTTLNFIFEGSTLPDTNSESLKERNTVLSGLLIETWKSLFVAIMKRFGGISSKLH